MRRHTFAEFEALLDDALAEDTDAGDDDRKATGART